MTDRNLHILGSPAFLVGLFLLLANDFVFKAQFHNSFTGKLSDFAGLFVFPLFWSAFFPRRKALIFIATAVLFVFWKSTYSKFLIEGWNSLPFFGIYRTVDYSDLWALLILPPAYFYSDTSSRVLVPNRLIYAIAIVSVVAFTATSFSHKVSYNNQYQFQMTRKDLLERMRRLPKNEVRDSFWGEGEKFEITFDPCLSQATLTLHEAENQSVITLKEMDWRCPSADDNEMRQYFEKEFINKLREEPVSRSAEVLWVHSSSPPPPANTSPLSSPSATPKKRH